MTLVSASAPGKVVLSGEYAVLDGAPAIGMAINKRARVQIVEIEGDVNRVTSPGHCEIEGRFKTTPNGIEWLQGQQHYEALDSVWRAASIAATLSKKIVLDTREFADPITGKKFGIGSSAALTVALGVALKRDENIAATARQAHADLQRGLGSGIDIACSINGGLLEYRMDSLQASSLRWPPGLFYRVLWTGVAVSTTETLARLVAGDDSAATLKPSRARLKSAAEKMAQSWRSAVAASIISEYQEYIEALRSFGDDHDLGIFDAGHDALVDAARASNLVYKPCGAGGGDIGIVFGMDASELQTFVDTHSPEYQPLDCELEYDGASLEQTQSENP